MKNILIILFTTCALTGFSQSVKDFTLPDVNTEKEVSLSDFTDKKGIVVIFTSNVCPYSIYYEGRITQLISEFRNKDIQFVLINSHKENKESASEMSNKIATWGLKVPYLADKEQVAKDIFGARKSPEVFLLKPTSGNKFDVYYNGAIDNNPQVASDVKNRFLKENIDNLLKGLPASRGGMPIGCMIK